LQLFQKKAKSIDEFVQLIHSKNCKVVEAKTGVKIFPFEFNERNWNVGGWRFKTTYKAKTQDGKEIIYSEVKGVNPPEDEEQATQSYYNMVAHQLRTIANRTLGVHTSMTDLTNRRYQLT
jgi:hypothetical protein